MSTFQMKTTEVTIEMDGLHITSVTRTERSRESKLLYQKEMQDENKTYQ